MNRQDSGRKGGLATRDNHISLCSCCGNPIKNAHFSEVGRKGGEATLRKYGIAFYSKVGHLGGRGNKRNGRGGDIADSLSAGRIGN